MASSGQQVTLDLHATYYDNIVVVLVSRNAWHIKLLILGRLGSPNKHPSAYSPTAVLRPSSPSSSTTTTSSPLNIHTHIIRYHFDICTLLVPNRLLKMQYVPFASDIEIPFYAALASHKINHDKLDDSARKLLGLYEIRPSDEAGNSSRMQIHANALTSDE